MIKMLTERKGTLENVLYHFPASLLSSTHLKLISASWRAEKDGYPYFRTLLNL